MKKPLLIILGLGILVIGYWTISPLFLDKKVNEKLEDIMAPAIPQEPVVATTTEASQKAAVTSTPNAPPPQVKQETSLVVLAQGAFTGLQDHNAEGRASLIKAGEKQYVRFEEDFNITNGPDLFVYLGKDGTYDPAARLGALKGNIGSQNYAIPSSISVANYNEVWVWCRAFSVAFGKAPLVKQ
ncbi:MAG: DM13 domain-containing protein [Candidatus Uhrbacteria bacterium]|nr:DM13 domain-containing protein [Candidatus Uhrbacteria bacterium]